MAEEDIAVVTGEVVVEVEMVSLDIFLVPAPSAYGNEYVFPFSLFFFNVQYGKTNYFIGGGGGGDGGGGGGC